MQLTAGFFANPKEASLAVIVDQGGDVNAFKSLNGEVFKCNARRLSSVTMSASGLNGSINTPENLAIERLTRRLMALVGVFSHSAVNDDNLKNIENLQE